MSDVSAKERRTRTLTIGGLAVALVLACGGTAVGATMVTSKMIQDDTIKRVDMNFEVGQDATSLTSPMTLTKDYQKVLSTRLSIDDGGGAGTAQAMVELSNPTPQTVVVNVMLVHNQDTMHTSTVRATLAPNEITTVLAGLLCDRFRAGPQTVTLRVGGAQDVVVESAFLSAYASPRI